MDDLKPAQNTNLQKGQSLQKKQVYRQRHVLPSPNQYEIHKSLYPETVNQTENPEQQSPTHVLNQSVNGSLALPPQNTSLSAKDRVLFALGRKPIPLKAQQPSIQEKVQPESSAWGSLSQIFGSPVDAVPTLPTPPELSLNTRAQNQSKLGENQTEDLSLNTSSQVPKQIAIATKGVPVKDTILNEGDQKLYQIWNNNISKAQENLKYLGRQETAAQILPQQNASSSLPSNVATISCEFCKKAFDASTILMHIGENLACKSYYGPRFVEMMKNKYEGKSTVSNVQPLPNTSSNLPTNVRTSPASQVQNGNAKTVDRVVDSAEKSQPQKPSFLSWAFDAKSPPPNPQNVPTKKVDPPISSSSEPAVQKADSTPLVPENKIPVANDENVDGNAKKPSVSTAKELSSKLIVLKNGKFRNVTTIICEFCKYGFEESSILIHIAKSPACKSYYGPRFDEMKEKKSQSVVLKAANQPENIPMANDENVDRNKKKQSVSPAKKSTSNLADLYNSMATIFCEFCKTVLGESTLMMHVGKNPACKSYYSPIFIEMKKKKSPKANGGKNPVQISKDHLEKLAMQNVILKSGNQSENVPMENLLTLLDKTQNVTPQTLESKILASQIQDVASKMEILPTKNTDLVLPNTKILLQKSPTPQVQSSKILKLSSTQPQNSLVTATKKTILQLPKNSSTADLLDPKSGFQISVLAPQTTLSKSQATGAHVSPIQNAGQSVNATLGSNSEKTVPITQTNISKSPKSVKVTTSNTPSKGQSISE